MPDPRVLELRAELQLDLAGRGESGMGFQMIEASVRIKIDGRTRPLDGEFLVLQSQFLLPIAPEPRILSADELRLVAESGEFPARIEVSNLDGLKVIENRLTGVSQHSHGVMAVPPLVRPVSRLTMGDEAFIRFSGSPLDHRVGDNGSLKPGTFATTFNDARMVPSGLAAVGRYALPNPLPANYAYTIVPPKGTQIQLGAVAPGFGQAGGGVEVLFPKGSKPSGFCPHRVPES